MQHKRVCIPHIGTFEIIQHSSELNIPDKLIAPSFYTTRFLQYDGVTDHQFIFFSEINTDLESYGKKLKSKIQKHPLLWKGFGTLNYLSGEVVFEPSEIKLDSLQSLAAEKIIRENAQHSVLVGDQQMTSNRVTEVFNKQDEKKSIIGLIGWMFFILIIVTLFIFLYVNKFEPSSTGLKTNVGY